MRFTVLLLALFIWGAAQGQGAVSQQVSQMKTSGRQFLETPLLQFHSDDVLNRSFALEGLSKGTIMSIDQSAMEALVNNRADHIEMPLPVSERSSVNLTLVRHEILAEDFALFTSDLPGIPVDYRPGVHYKGIVDGDPNSLVAISVFNDEIMGMISTSQGNMVLGKINNDRENRHVLYSDTDLDRTSDFECGTQDDGLPYTEEELNFTQDSRDVGDCVRVYIEIDDDIVTQKGGATAATNYITGLFNQSFVLYANDNVSLTISEILAWTTNSPYSGTSSSQMLNSFQSYTGEFNGNVGHLVSYQASGGIAVLDGVCQTNPDWRKCFSSIQSSYLNVPTYSWSVMVVTHEMGHVIGSKHTHACSWNGNNTAIDGCAGSTEGSCPLPPIPQGGGTIMSYCHLQSVGINFNLGFGTQPGNVIRSRVNAANNCLTSCGPPPPPPPPAYCAANGNNSSYEWIHKVVLGTINNTSGNNSGYGNYVALTTNLTKGTTYSITLTPGFSSGSFNEFWKVWIDYNGDLDWADAGEQVAQGSGSGAITVNFTVPSGNTSLTTRMRVAMQYNAYPPNCGSFTYGEVEDYTVAIVPTSGGGGTCTDGIQNQGETGIDCGGPCDPCPPAASCTDGIQNQGETGIDCGGPCQPCPPSASCTDGIQNQGETGIDCGGPCEPCPPSASCSDGIQNQGETGIDCGGPCEPCPPPAGDNVLSTGYFETGWDGWLDGGSDVHRVSSANSYEGQYSIRIKDNSGVQSSMTSPSFDVSTGVIGLQIQFYFYTYGIEVGEDFWVQYRNTSNGNWVTIGIYTRGTNFNNNTFYSTTVLVPNFVPTSSATFRIRCDASDNSDLVFVDHVIISSIPVGGLPGEEMIIEEVETPVDFSTTSIENPHSEKELVVYPNPVQDFLNINFDGDINALRVIGMDGKEINVSGVNHNRKMVDISHLVQGIYFLWVESEGNWYPAKFSKM